MNKKLNTRSLGRCGKKSYSGTFQKNKKCNSLRVFWISIFSLILLVAITIYLLSSNWLNIKVVEVEGVDSVNKQAQIEAIAYKQQESKNFLFSQESLVFFNRSELIKNLDEFNFSELKIEKKYFSKKLIISAQEREKSLIFKEGEYFHFLDIEGNIISSQIDCQSELLLPENLEKTEEEVEGETDNNIYEIKKEAEDCLNFNDAYKQESLYPLIDNNGGNRLIESQKRIKLESEYIDFSLKLYNDLRGEEQFDLNRIVLDDDYNTIKARLNNNLDLYFNFEDDYLEQVSKFFTLKREKGSELESKKYIDLRYGDKIFYY